MGAEHLGRLPSKEEFDEIAKHLSDQIVQACLPSLLLRAMDDLARSGHLPQSVRQLMQYERKSLDGRERDQSPSRRR